jgi:phage terminase large subunit
MTASGSPTPLPHNYAPRWYQQPLWDALTRRDAAGNLDPVRRIDAVIHRRGGKDFTAWNAAILLANEWRVGTYYYSLPTYGQAKRAIWKGRTLDPTGVAPSLRFLDCVPPDRVARKHGAPAISDGDMSVEFDNGSILQLVGGDNYNSLVGANPVFLCLSEWSLTDPEALDYFRPMITNNDGVIVYLYTPRGHNHGKRTHDRHQQLQRERPDRYFSVLLPNSVTRAIADEAIADDRAEGMSDAKIAQEYECDFEVANEGSYYGRLMAQARKEQRIGRVPADPSLPVDLFFDIGVSDHTVIGFVQSRGNLVLGIDYYANHGEGLAHYVQVLEDWGRERGYRYRRDAEGRIRAIGPHDIEQRSKNDGKSYREYGREHGIAFTALKSQTLESGIEATRALLPRLFWDEARCARWIEALESYSKKWNDALKVWSDEPLHDWASHPADMTRYLAQGLKLMAESQGTFTRPATREPSPWEMTGRR